MANHILSMRNCFGSVPEPTCARDKSHSSFPICTLPICQDDGLHFDLGNDGHDSLDAMFNSCSGEGRDRIFECDRL